MQSQGETSYKDTPLGIIPRSKIVGMEAIGTKIGLNYLFKLSPSNLKISSTLILELHQLSFSDILGDQAGHFRQVQVTYSGKEAPLYPLVPELVYTLCEDTEYAFSKLPPTEDKVYLDRLIELLARFQHRFVYIHPFIDYNGRTARMFTNYMLMRANMPVSEINVDKPQSRSKYILALQKADNGDYMYLEKIIGSSITESLEKILQ